MKFGADKVHLNNYKLSPELSRQFALLEFKLRIRVKTKN